MSVGNYIIKKQGEKPENISWCMMINGEIYNMVATMSINNEELLVLPYSYNTQEILVDSKPVQINHIADYLMDNYGEIPAKIIIRLMVYNDIPKLLYTYPNSNFTEFLLHPNTLKS